MKRNSNGFDSRCLIWLLASLCAAVGYSAAERTARGQREPDRQPDAVKPSPAGAGKAEVTLDELKVRGAQRSSYRKRQLRVVDTAVPEANLTGVRREVEPILRQNCVACHGPEKQEGNIRLDTLDPDLFGGDDVNWWIEVFAVLSNGEMPPVDASELAEQDRGQVIDWLSSELQVASTVRRLEQGHSSFRRMTRYEYKYALQDLLGLPYDFAKDLPPESTSEDGFQNSSELLHMSSIQFATYR